MDQVYQFNYKGKDYDMPWSKPTEPTDDEIKAFVSSKGGVPEPEKPKPAYKIEKFKPSKFGEGLDKALTDFGKGTLEFGKKVAYDPTELIKTPARSLAQSASSIKDTYYDPSYDGHPYLRASKIAGKALASPFEALGMPIEQTEKDIVNKDYGGAVVHGGMSLLPFTGLLGSEVPKVIPKEVPKLEPVRPITRADRLLPEKAVGNRPRFLQGNEGLADAISPYKMDLGESNRLSLTEKKDTYITNPKTGKTTKVLSKVKELPNPTVLPREAGEVVNLPPDVAANYGTTLGRPASYFDDPVSYVEAPQQFSPVEPIAPNIMEGEIVQPKVKPPSNRELRNHLFDEYGARGAGEATDIGSPKDPRLGLGDIRGPGLSGRTKEIVEGINLPKHKTGKYTPKVIDSPEIIEPVENLPSSDWPETIDTTVSKPQLEPVKSLEVENRAKPLTEAELKNAEVVKAAIAAKKNKIQPVEAINPKPVIELVKPLDIMDESGSADLSKFKNVSPLDTAMEVGNFARSVKASFDLSAPFRQGALFVHRKEFWKAMPDMIRSFGKQEHYDTLMKSIESHPDFKLAHDSGLSITNLTKDAKRIAEREERFSSVIADLIPGVKHSGRAYTAFLDKLRMDTFSDLAKKSKDLGLELVDSSGKPTKHATEIAEYVNNATGRGSLKFSKNLNAEPAATFLNSFLFSPRLAASRVQVFKSLVSSNPLIRRRALTDMLTFTAIGNTVLGLATLKDKLSGSKNAENAYNPIATDFGKLKYGNTHISAFSDFPQYARTLARLYQGEYKNSSGQVNKYNAHFGSKTRKDEVYGVLEGKEAPLMAFTRDLLEQKDPQGNKIDIPTETIKLFAPMILEDMYQISKSNPELLPLEVLNVFGVNMNTYEDFKPKSKGMFQKVR